MSTGTVSVEEVRRVAELASLQLSADEEPRMQRDLNAILGYIAQLDELNTADVPPMAQVSELLTEGADIAPDLTGGSLRPDQVQPSEDRKRILAEAPETDGRFFKVPKVIERA